MRPAAAFPGTVSRAPAERELLHAVSDLIAADRAMRAAMAREMGLGESDLRAVRFVMASTRADRLTSPHELAEHLGITTAATTTLLDRLTAAGHVQRVSHPTDGRAKVVVATEHAYESVRGHLADPHDGMRAAAARVPEHARAAVVAFLDEITAVMRESTDRA